MVLTGTEIYILFWKNRYTREKKRKKGFTGDEQSFIALEADEGLKLYINSFRYHFYL